MKCAFLISTHPDPKLLADIASALCHRGLFPGTFFSEAVDSRWVRIRFEVECEPVVVEALRVHLLEVVRLQVVIVSEVAALPEPALPAEA